MQTAKNNTSQLTSFYRSLQWNVSIIALAFVLALASGCETSPKSSSNLTDSGTDQTNRSGGGGFTRSMKDLFDHPEATVKIPFEDDFAEVRVTISSFPANRNASDGIAALQTMQWDEAVRKFEAAVQDKPGNGSFHFALAVVQEVKGNYTEARRHYLEANRIKGGDGHFDAQAGLKRLELREQK